MSDLSDSLLKVAKADLRMFADAKSAQQRALIRNDVAEYFGNAGIADVHLENAAVNFADHTMALIETDAPLKADV